MVINMLVLNTTENASVEHQSMGPKSMNHTAQILAPETRPKSAGEQTMFLSTKVCTFPPPYVVQGIEIASDFKIS